MPITVPLNNSSLLVDAASESLNNFNIYYYYENAPENVASLQLNSCKVLREFTYTNIITGNGLFTFNVPEKIPGIFALQLLKCYVDVQPRLQELTETIRVNGQYPLSAFITELDETDGISKDSVINVDVSGDVPVLESKTITISSNGSQNVLPSSGYDGLSSVSLSVNVPVPKIEIGKSERISTNGIVNITPDSGYDALESVRVNVAVPNGTETKSITSNGTYTPTSPNIGFSSVTVNVPQENLNIENSKMVNISSNGLKNVLPSSGFDALGKVQVNVAVPNETETKTITSNGIYTPTSPNIGFSSVTVNVPEPNIQGNKTLATITTNGDSIVTPSNGYDAMQKVTFSVNVPNGTETKTITGNGTYTPTSPNIGFSSVTVNVPTNEAVLEDTSIGITTNTLTEVTPSSGYDGISKLYINTNIPQKITGARIKYGSNINYVNISNCIWIADNITNNGNGNILLIGLTVRFPGAIHLVTKKLGHGESTDEPLLLLYKVDPTSDNYTGEIWLVDDKNSELYHNHYSWNNDVDFTLNENDYINGSGKLLGYTCSLHGIIFRYYSGIEYKSAYIPMQGLLAGEIVEADSTMYFVDKMVSADKYVIYYKSSNRKIMFKRIEYNESYTFSMDEYVLLSYLVPSSLLSAHIFTYFELVDIYDRSLYSTWNNDVSWEYQIPSEIIVSL